MYYFVLTALHLAHVIVGLVVFLVMSTLARKPGVPHTRIAVFEGTGASGTWLTRYGSSSTR